LVVGWCGAPFRDPSVFGAFDLVLSCVPELVARFREMGLKSEHVNHAFEPRILERISKQRSGSIGLSFVGQVVRERGYHAHREEMLRSLVNQVDLEVFSPAHALSWKDDLRAFAKRGLYEAFRFAKGVGLPQSVLAGVPVVGKVAGWPSAPMSPRLRGFGGVLRPPVFGLEMYRTLRDSRVTLNSHIELSRGSASNMRLFEATGAGACLLTDWKPNLGELFESDSEVVSYRSIEECLEKAKWLLAHPVEAEQIARRGQARTLRDHTFDKRAGRFHELVRDALTR
jgi:hypothetical protein